ncbi:MAG: DUF3341 domain-containing protein [Deltaproteobacteria bacterium]|nr:DUF3341 domain-containing protein [Deltaproteobacteria bacterium]
MSRRSSGLSPALLAIFARPQELEAALGAVQGRGLPFTVHSPVHGADLLGRLNLPPSPIRFVTLAGFFAGTASGLGLCAFTALRWGLIVSGKPVLSWVPFTVVAFELSILLGVLSTLGALLVLGRLPRFRLPGYYDPRFSSDRFGLLVLAGAGSEAESLRAALHEAGAEEVRDVDA